VADLIQMLFANAFELVVAKVNETDVAGQFTVR
jgi:hypothetical protein